MTLADYIADYRQRYMTPALLRPRSIQTMSSHIRTIESGLGSRPVTGLDYKTIQGFFNALAETRKPKSVRNVYGTLHVVLAQAHREGVIPSVPAPKLPPSPQTPQRFFTVSQMRRIISASNHKAFWWLLAETGVRINEALSLQPEDLTDVIRIHRNLKTYNALRDVSVSDNLRVLLGGELPFSGCRTVWWNRLQALLHELDIPAAGFHGFRRGTATYLDSKGMPESLLSQRMGWKKPGMLQLYSQKQKHLDKPWAEMLSLELGGHNG